MACKRPNTSDRHFVDLSPAEHTWVLNGLHIYRNYSCWLRAYNNYGNGTWSKELVISTDEDGMLIEEGVSRIKSMIDDLDDR